MYLNKINLGNRSYGIATAAQNYYGKELKELTFTRSCDACRFTKSTE